MLEFLSSSSPVLVPLLMGAILIYILTFRTERQSDLAGGLGLASTLLMTLIAVVLGAMVMFQRTMQAEQTLAWQQAAVPLIEARIAPFSPREVWEITAQDIEHALDPCYPRDWRERTLPSTTSCQDPDRQTAIRVSLR